MKKDNSKFGSPYYSLTRFYAKGYDWELVEHKETKELYFLLYKKPNTNPDYIYHFTGAGFREVLKP